MHDKKKLSLLTFISPLRRKGLSPAEAASVSQIVIRKRIKDVLFLLFGVLSAGLGLRGFLMPMGF